MPFVADYDAYIITKFTAYSLHDLFDIGEPVA
jgi:hypothetical protein